MGLGPSPEFPMAQINGAHPSTSKCKPPASTDTECFLWWRVCLFHMGDGPNEATLGLNVVVVAQDGHNKCKH